MIIKEYQEFKPVQRALGLKADGLPGPKTLAAVALKLRCHEMVRGPGRRERDA